MKTIILGTHRQLFFHLQNSIFAIVCLLQIGFININHHISLFRLHRVAVQILQERNHETNWWLWSLQGSFLWESNSVVSWRPAFLLRLQLLRLWECLRKLKTVEYFTNTWIQHLVKFYIFWNFKVGGADLFRIKGHGHSMLKIRIDVGF